MLVAEAVAATVAATVPDPDEAAWLLGHAGQAAVVIGVDAGAGRIRLQVAHTSGGVYQRLSVLPEPGVSDPAVRR